MRKREAAASIASVFAGNGKRGGGGGLFAPKKPIFGFGMGKKAKKSKKPAAKVGNSKVSVNVVDVSVKSTTVSVGEKATRQFLLFPRRSVCVLQLHGLRRAA